MRRAISVILGGVKRSVGIIKYDIVVMENVMLIMMTRAGGSQAQNSSRPPHLLFCLHLSDPGSAPHRRHLHWAGTRNGDTKVLFKTLAQSELVPTDRNKMSGYFIQLADQAQEGVTGGVQVPRARLAS